MWIQVANVNYVVWRIRRRLSGCFGGARFREADGELAQNGVAATATVPSSSPYANRSPEGSNATLTIPAVARSYSLRSVPSFTFQNRMEAKRGAAWSPGNSQYPSPTMSVAPSGEKAKELGVSE